MSVFSQYFGKIRSPQAGEKVYKDECAYSFDNPVSGSARFEVNTSDIISDFIIWIEG